jgi:hypothetical protein
LQALNEGVMGVALPRPNTRQVMVITPRAVGMRMRQRWFSRRLDMTPCGGRRCPRRSVLPDALIRASEGAASGVGSVVGRRAWWGVGWIRVEWGARYLKVALTSFKTCFGTCSSCGEKTGW